MIRWWYYINNYSVNILFWDQWDFYDAFFESHNLWEVFRWQVGPHRQGVGGILTEIVAQLSGWNNRVEAFTIGGIVCLAMFCGLILKRRLYNSWSWSDVAIPLMFLTPLQYEMFAGTPNLSHGSVPLFLLIVYCLVWTLSISPLRYMSILFVNFLLIFTGFGVFIGIITPVMIIMEYSCMNRVLKNKERLLLLVSLLVSLLSAGAFFVGYRFRPAVPNFEFPVDQYWAKYPLFISIALANFCGVKDVPLLIIAPVGFICLFVMIGIEVFHARRFVTLSRQSPIAYGEMNLSQIILILTTFTLIFSINLAIGRISLGLEAAQASRYVTYLIPGFLGIYLHILASNRQENRALLSIILVTGLLWASFPLRDSDLQILESYRSGKIRWKNCYLKTEDIEKSNQLSGIKVHPDPERTHLRSKLDYLKRRELNLYLDHLE